MLKSWSGRNINRNIRVSPRFVRKYVIRTIEMETIRAEGEERGRTKMNLRTRIPPLENRRTRIFPDSHILFTFSSILGNRLKNPLFCLKDVLRRFLFFTQCWVQLPKNCKTYKLLLNVNTISTMYQPVVNKIVYSMLNIPLLLFINICQQ